MCLVCTPYHCLDALCQDGDRTSSRMRMLVIQPRCQKEWDMLLRRCHEVQPPPTTGRESQGAKGSQSLHLSLHLLILRGQRGVQHSTMDWHRAEPYIQRNEILSVVSPKSRNHWKANFSKKLAKRSTIMQLSVKVPSNSST